MSRRKKFTEKFIRHSEVALIRAMTQKEILKESRYRTAYSYEILPEQLVKESIRTTLNIPEVMVKEAFDKVNEPDGTLEYLKNVAPRVPLILLSQPKVNLLLNESLKVDGVAVPRLNRFDASAYTTWWLRRYYLQDKDKAYADFKHPVNEVLRALIAYAPKTDGEQSVCKVRWGSTNIDNTVDDLMEWILERITPYIPYDVEVSFRGMKQSLGKELQSLIEQLSFDNVKDLKKPSVNPLLGIQDFFNFDAFKDETHDKTSEAIYRAVKWYIDGSLRFLAINKKIPQEIRQHVISVVDELFHVYAKVKLKFDEPYDVQFDQLLYLFRPILEGLEESYEGQVELNLDEAQSNHVEIRVTEGALSFHEQTNDFIALKDVTGNDIATLKANKVFGRVHIETEKCRHFYTTKDFVSFTDQDGKIHRASRVVIPLKVGVSRRSLTLIRLILWVAGALSASMVLLADQNVFVAGLALYAIFLGLALFPKEHYLTLFLLRRQLNKLKWIALGGVSLGAISLILSKAKVLSSPLGFIINFITKLIDP